MSMSRKDYVLLARAILMVTADDQLEPAHRAGARMVATRIAQAIGAANDNFDYARFFAAAGINTPQSTLTKVVNRCIAEGSPVITEQR